MKHGYEYEIHVLYDMSKYKEIWYGYGYDALDSRLDKNQKSVVYLVTRLIVEIWFCRTNVWYIKDIKKLLK